MLYREIARILSVYLLGFILPLLAPLAIAFYCEFVAGSEVYPQPVAFFAILVTCLTCALLGLLLKQVSRKSIGQLYRREALLLVVILYFLTPFLGGLPFWLNGTFENLSDAYFEAVSGLTTTGATLMEPKVYDPKTGKELVIEKTVIAGSSTTYTFEGTIIPVFKPQTKTVLLEGIEAVNPALIFWRSLMQWLGGGGIILLFVSILPALGVGGKVFYQAEVSGPTKDSLAPRIKETVNSLWKVYLGLTVAQTILLLLTNEKLSLFEALTLSFSTVSTGGFSPKNTSIASYNNTYTEWIILLFMITGSISFSLYFFCMRGRFARLNDPELKLFLSIIIFSSLFATFTLWNAPRTPLEGAEEGAYSLSEAFRLGTFQTIAAQSSTGFAVANFDKWPFPIQTWMLILMLIGGMAGSTAGGIKVIRLKVFFKVFKNKLETLFRPDAVRNYQIGATKISSQSALTLLSFILIVILLTIFGAFLLILDEVDPETSFTTALSMINNIGLGFRMGGPANSFAFLSLFGKAVCSLLMIGGRLEIFALLMIFTPAFWKRG